MDSRGILYENSKIVVIRNNKELEIQNQESEIIVTIPPGEYQVEIYDNNELIGKRAIEVYGEKNYDLITCHQPSYPAIIMIAGLLLIGISFVFLYYKKCLHNFYLIVPIILLAITFVLPWWQIHGSMDHLQTTTKLYFIPNNMVALTSTQQTIAGELSYIPTEFQNVLMLMGILTATSAVLLIGSRLFTNIRKKWLSQIINLAPILLLIGSLSLFVIALNELCKVSLGSIFGTGYVEIGVPGESQIHSVLCSWGPDIGFYLYLISTGFLFLTITINYLKNRSKE
jgi:hypothetical protein